MIRLPWGIALIVAGMAWSCGNGLGFDPPDEEDLADTWTSTILDGDYPTQLEFTTEGDENIFIRREVDRGSEDMAWIEYQRGTYSLAPESDPDYPSIRFEPVGAPADVSFIIYYDATTLDLSDSPDGVYDPTFPSFTR